MVSIQKKSDQTWLFCLERSKKWRDELIAKSKSMQMTMELIGIQSSDCPFAKRENVLMEKVLSVKVTIDLINQCEGGFLDMKASKEKL